MNTPGARLDLVGRTVAFSLGYFPSLAGGFGARAAPPALPDALFGRLVGALRDASESRSAKTARRPPKLRVSQPADRAHGRLGCPGTSPAALQLLPGAQTIRYGSSRSLGVDGGARVARSAAHVVTKLLHRRWSRHCFARGYPVADHAARPARRHGDSHRRNTITTTFAAVDSTFTAFPCDPSTGGPPTAASLALTPNATCAPHDDFVEPSETWRRRLTRSDELALAAGVSAARGRFDLAGERTVVLPTGAQRSFIDSRSMES